MTNITSEGYFPAELKRAISAIDNETRIRLVAELLKSTELSYTEILNILNIRKGSLTHHLIELAKGAIIRNFVKDERISEYESFYSLTRFGRAFIEALHQVLHPPLVEYEMSNLVASASYYYPRKDNTAHPTTAATGSSVVPGPSLV